MSIHLEELPIRVVDLTSFASQLPRIAISVIVNTNSLLSWENFASPTSNGVAVANCVCASAWPIDFSNEIGKQMTEFA